MKIRIGMFETNSSSTHSICIKKCLGDTLENLPEELNFYKQDFGWEYAVYNDTQSKANYLHQAICGLYHAYPKKIKECQDYITKELGKFGIVVSFSDTDANNRICSFIDHPSELREFVEAVCRTPIKLMKYLFSEESFVITGNDNDNHDVGIYVNYPHDEYYKSN